MPPVPRPYGALLLNTAPSSRQNIHANVSCYLQDAESSETDRALNAVLSVSHLPLPESCDKALFTCRDISNAELPGGVKLELL